MTADPDQTAGKSGRGRDLRALLRGRAPKWDKIDRPSFSEAWQWQYRATLLSSGFTLPGQVWRNFAGLLPTFMHPKSTGQTSPPDDTPPAEPGVPPAIWPEPFILALLSKPPSPIDINLLRKMYHDTLVVMPPDLRRQLPDDVHNQGMRLDTNAALMDRLLNGIHPCHFERDRTTTARKLHVCRLAWQDDEFDTDGPWLHAHITIRAVRKHGALVLHNITIDGAAQGLGKMHAEASAEGGGGVAELKLQKARHIVRSTLLLLGQTDKHLGAAHVALELAAWLLGFSQPSDEPLGTSASTCRLPAGLEVLRPHLRDVAGINHFGEPLIFGHTGALPRTTNMTPPMLELRMGRAALTQLLFRGRPTAPRCENDLFGKAAFAAWEATELHVRAQVGKLTPSLLWALVGRAWAVFQALIQSGQWRYLWLFVHPRHRTLSALGGLLAAGLCRSPRETLVRTCTQLIHTATFTHTWFNEAQQIDGGDPWFATLGLRREALTLPPTLPLDDWRAAVTPHIRDVSFQLFLAYTLTHVNLGFMADEDDPRRAAERYDQQKFGDRALLLALREAYDTPLASLDGQTAAAVMTASGQPLNRLRVRINT